MADQYFGAILEVYSEEAGWRENLSASARLGRRIYMINPGLRDALARVPDVSPYLTRVTERELGLLRSAGLERAGGGTGPPCPGRPGDRERPVPGDGAGAGRPHRAGRFPEVHRRPAQRMSTQTASRSPSTCSATSTRYSSFSSSCCSTASSSEPDTTRSRRGEDRDTHRRGPALPGSHRRRVRRRLELGRHSPPLGPPRGDDVLHRHPEPVRRDRDAGLHRLRHGLPAARPVRARTAPRRRLGQELEVQRQRAHADLPSRAGRQVVGRRTR